MTITIHASSLTTEALSVRRLNVLRVGYLWVAMGLVDPGPVNRNGA